jgi:hypothetical protein
MVLLVGVITSKQSVVKKFSTDWTTIFIRSYEPGQEGDTLTKTPTK